MKNLVNIKTTVALSIAAMLVACGGGSGGSSSSSSPTSLNLNAAYSSMLKNGNSVLYTLAGDCTGYSSHTALPAYDFKNYATPAVDVWAVDTLKFDTLSTASQASEICKEVFNSNNNEVQTQFYNPSNQAFVASGWPSYWTVFTEQTPLPTSVSAGSTGTMATWKNFDGASSTTGSPVETGTITYAVSADTATSLLVTVTNTAIEVASGKTAWTQKNTYRLNSDNTLTALSISWDATANSNLKAPLLVNGTATAAITLNAQAVKIASMTAGATDRYTVFDGNGNQCTPNLTIVTSALASSGGTTQQGTSYAKSNTSTFNPSTLTGSGNCSNINFPVSENSYYDVNYALVQASSNNTNNVSYNITASAQPLPNAATIGSNGQQYTFKRYSSTSPSTPMATGNSIYYVGAITPNKLAFFDVETKNYTDGRRAARNIFVKTAETNNGSTPFYGYINDSIRMYLIPTK